MTTAAPQSPRPRQCVDARDHEARRKLLIGELWSESTHKKFILNRGREPLRHTVDRKTIMDLMARSLLESLGNPSVPYYLSSSKGKGPLSAEHSSTSTLSPLSCKTDRPITLAKRRRTGTPAWRDLAVELQLLVVNVALFDAQQTLAFSLNLGTELAKRLIPGTKEARDEIRNRISRALLSKFHYKVPFVVVLEMDHDGRLHAHGALGLDPDHLPRATEALQVAGGTWTSAGANFQVKVDVMYDPVGWGLYVTKDLRRRPANERSRWVGWSQPAKQMAKTFYESVRGWWALSREDLTIRHSMRFFIGVRSIFDDSYFPPSIT